MTSGRLTTVFTGRGIYTIEGVNRNNGISATNIRFKFQSEQGCADVKPVLLKDSILFVDESGTVVRDLYFQLEDDGLSGDDQTLMAKHLFRGKSIVAMAYQGGEFGILWCALSDGNMATLTYNRIHQMWAWTPIETEGNVIDVAASNENGYITGEREVYIRTVEPAPSDTDPIIKNKAIVIEKIVNRVLSNEIEDGLFSDCGKRSREAYSDMSVYKKILSAGISPSIGQYQCNMNFSMKAALVG